jgi:hypothetical protein
MRTLKMSLAVAVAALGLSGCGPSQAEFDALRADYDQLKLELNEWAGDPGADGHPDIPGGTQLPYLSVKEWQDWTKGVICDVVANPPAGVVYTPETINYCSSADPNGDPEDPPGFGA